MGSDPQSYLQAMHEMEHKACNERIAALEAEVAECQETISSLTAALPKTAVESAAEAMNLRTELIEERARLDWVLGALIALNDRWRTQLYVDAKTERIWNQAADELVTTVPIQNLSVDAGALGDAKWSMYRRAPIDEARKKK